MIFLGKRILTALTTWLPLRAMAALLVLIPTAMAHAQEGGVATGSSVKAYNIPLLQDGTLFFQPVNQYSFFFEVRPKVKILDNSYVDIKYRCSELIANADGAITIQLNGKPQGSRRIGAGTPIQGLWHQRLHIEDFKTTGFNELKIMSRQRTVNGPFMNDGPCKDLDNSGNWIKFLDGTKFHFERYDPPMFPLASYPFPFLDPLCDSTCQTTLVLPNGADKTGLAEALGLASDWGWLESLRPLDIHISTSGERPGQNLVMGGGGGSITGNPGALEVTSRGPSQSRLQVIGSTPEGLTFARTALRFPETTRALTGYKSSVDRSAIAGNRHPTTRLGEFTFEQLRMDDIKMAGAFHQHAGMTIQRPIRTDLGRDSYITLHFRHSATLNPLRSILTLKINQLPIGSVRLDNENVNGGVLTTRIPVSELQKSVWQLDLEAYHDLATVADCTKSFEEVAWTVVEKSSAFTLSTGLLNGHPYLEDFPYLVGKDGVAAPKLTIALSANPTDTELSAAAVIAARASQKNRHPYDWEVLNGTIPDSKASSLAIGYYDEVSRFANIAKDLLVAPTGAHTFKIDPRIRVMSSSLEGGAVLQAVRSPGSDTGVLYVLLAADDAALRRFTDVLTNPKRVSQLRDEVVVLNADGTIVPFSTQNEALADEKGTAEKDRFTPQMTAVWIGLIVLVILVIIYVGSKFRKRSPK